MEGGGDVYLEEAAAHAKPWEGGKVVCVPGTQRERLMMGREVMGGEGAGEEGLLGQEGSWAVRKVIPPSWGG